MILISLDQIWQSFSFVQFVCTCKLELYMDFSYCDFLCTCTLVYGLYSDMSLDFNVAVI